MRTAGWLAGLFGAAAVAALFVGRPAGPALVACVGLVGWAVTAQAARRAAPDAPWHTVTGTTLAVGGAPGRASPATIAATLGRFEGRHLVVTPWFGAGLGFLLVMILLFGAVFAGETAEPWADMVQLAPWFVHPFVGMVVIAMHRATTRPERDGTSELYATCPADVSTRTAGLLVAAWVPVVVLVVFLAVMYAALALANPLLHGPLVAANGGDLLSAVILGCGGVALGVALGRWLRFGLAPLVAVVAVGFLATGLNGVGGRGWNPLVALSTAPTIEAPSPVFADRPGGWHALWIAGLTAVVAMSAVAHDRRDRRVALAVAGCTIVTIGAGVAATRPMSPSSAERIAAHVAFPERAQRCADASVSVKVCVFPLHEEILDLVVEDIAPVAAALPRAAGTVTVRQIYQDGLTSLPPEVRDELPRSVPPRPVGEVALSRLDDLQSVVLGPRFDLALAAVGLPAHAGRDLLPAVAAGQARGVVAIWLASRGLGPDGLREATTSPNAASGDRFERGSLELVGDCSVPSVVWSEQDLAAARTVVALPPTTVERVLEAGWAQWVDPATGTDELLAALGLAPAGPFDDVQPRPGNPC